MTDDPELTAIKAALEHLATLPDRRAWQRALDYIASRLTECERTVWLDNRMLALPEPQQFCIAGEITDVLADADDGDGYFIIGADDVGGRGLAVDGGPQQGRGGDGGRHRGGLLEEIPACKPGRGT